MEQRTNPQTSITTVNVARVDGVINALLDGAKVYVSDIGYLEVATLPSRKTVFFKQSEEGQTTPHNDPFGLDALARLLRAGEAVKVPELGEFRPRQVNGKLQVSYVLPPSLRKYVNGEEIFRPGVSEDEETTPIPTATAEPIDDAPATEPVAETPTETEIVPTVTAPVVTEVEPLSNAELLTMPDTQPVESKSVATSNTVEPVAPTPSETTTPTNTDPRKTKDKKPEYKKRDLLSWDEDSKKDRQRRSREHHRKKGWNFDRIFTYVIVAGLIFAGSWYLFSKFYHGKTPYRPPAHRSEELQISLPELSEANYGNSAFWVYIYEYNKEKINSPVNIPAGTEIIVPNLIETFGVNPTDEEQIKDAIIQGNLILGIN